MESKSLMEQVFGFTLLLKDAYNSKLYKVHKLDDNHDLPSELDNLTKENYFIVEEIPIKKTGELSPIEYNRKIETRLKVLKELCKIDCFSDLKAVHKTKTHYYYFYEYDDKSNLAKISDKLTNKEALERLRAFLDAYKVLKEKKVLHRLIRPEFVFFEKDKLKLVLFSFSCDGDGDRPLRTTVKNSTLYYDYLSKDEVNNKEYNIELDIDKIGVLFYFMLFGVKPRKDKMSFENRMEERLGHKIVEVGA